MKQTNQITSIQVDVNVIKNPQRTIWHFQHTWHIVEKWNLRYNLYQKLFKCMQICSDSLLVIKKIGNIYKCNS